MAYELTDEQVRQAVQLFPSKTFDFYSDSGHGWLKVPQKVVLDGTDFYINSCISNCSMVNGNFFYLEEDCDMPLFIHALAASGYRTEFRNHWSENSKIRNYDSISEVLNTDDYSLKYTNEFRKNTLDSYLKELISKYIDAGILEFNDKDEVVFAKGKSQRDMKKILNPPIPNDFLDVAEWLENADIKVLKIVKKYDDEPIKLTIQSKNIKGGKPITLSSDRIEYSCTDTDNLKILAMVSEYGAMNGIETGIHSDETLDCSDTFALFPENDIFYSGRKRFSPRFDGYNTVPYDKVATVNINYFLSVIPRETDKEFDKRIDKIPDGQHRVGQIFWEGFDTTFNCIQSDIENFVDEKGLRGKVAIHFVPSYYGDGGSFIVLPKLNALDCDIYYGIEKVSQQELDMVANRIEDIVGFYIQNEYENAIDMVENEQAELDAENEYDDECVVNKINKPQKPKPKQ